MSVELELVRRGNISTQSGIGLAKQTDEILTAVAIDHDGRLNVAWVNGTRPWVGPLPIGAPDLDPASGVALTKQNDNTLTAAAIGADGRLHVAWVEGTGIWNGPVPVGAAGIAPSSGIALAHQTDDILTAAMVGAGGHLHIAWVVGTGQWQGPVPVGAGVLHPQSRIALAKQGGDVLTAVAIGGDGTLHVAWVNEDGSWNGPVPVGGPILAPTAGVALAQQAGDTLTAVSIGKDRRLHIAWVDGTGDWSGPIPIGGADLDPRSGVAAFKQGGDILTAVAVGLNGELRVAWVNDGGTWNGPVAVGPGVLDPSGGAGLCSQTPDILTAVLIGQNGTLHVAWVDGTNAWNGPVPINGASRRICQLTGNYDPEGLPHRNDSTTAHVAGTDLGFPVAHDDHHFFLFGDQFDDPYLLNRDPIGISWAGQVDPDGIDLDFIRDGPGFRPIDVVGINHPLLDFETPTGGFVDNGRLWSFINAKIPGQGNNAQPLLASTDSVAKPFGLHYQLDGRRFALAGGVPIDNADWPGLPSDRGRGLLVIGQGFNPYSAYLGWVALPIDPVEVTDQLGAPWLPVQYYRGPATSESPWTPDPMQATALFEIKAVSFVSLAWVSDLERWVALYTECWPKNREDPARAFGEDPGWERPIVIRSSPAPWGPWSDPLPLLYPGEAYGRYLHNPSGGPQPMRFDPFDPNIDGWLYAPALINGFTRTVEGATSLYYVLSTGAPYHVQLMRSDVRRKT